MADAFAQEQKNLTRFKIVVTDAESETAGSSDAHIDKNISPEAEQESDSGMAKRADQAKLENGDSQIITGGLPVDPFIERMRPDVTPYNWDSGYEFYTFGTDSAWQAWWNRRGRQIFNVLYFGAGICALYTVAHTSEFLDVPARMTALLFFVLMMVAFAYSFSPRAGDSSFSLSTEAQKKLRRIGLITPLLAMLLAGWNCLAYGVEQFSSEFMAKDGPMTSRDYIKWRDETIGAQLVLSPLNTAMQKRLFREAFTLGLHNHSLKIANRIVFFNPRSVSWKVKRLAVLGRMPEREEEYNKKASQYKLRYARYGTLWNTLADVAMIKQNWPEALENSNQHIKLHDNEPRALEQRAAIYRELGRFDDANADFAAAMLIRESWRAGHSKPATRHYVPDSNLRSFVDRY